ncbi:MAG: double-strand break repair protein AddB [Beijerinckiaceae bacterium]
MTERDHRIFSIPPGQPFLPMLADALLDGTLLPSAKKGNSIIALADLTIFLPTQRAVRAFRHILAERQSHGVLPRILPLGRFEDNVDADGDDVQDILQTAHSNERLLYLVGLISAWKKEMQSALPLRTANDHHLLAGTVEDQFALARELTRLFDTLIIHSVHPDEIENCMPPEHDDFWRITQNFLTIATRSWPAHLGELGLIDPMQQRQDTIRKFIAEVEKPTSTHRYIIAGSTGSQPATAQLMRAITQNGKGCVVLPGLDRFTPDAVFGSLIDGAQDVNHPQFMLARTLRIMGVSRDEIIALARGNANLEAREKIAALTQYPAEHTVEWHHFDPERRGMLARALHDCSVVEAADEEHEAKAIACALRETAEHPEKTAALITNDRMLAQRVTEILARWNIAVQDSAGVPLAQTREGALAALIADWMIAPHSGETIVPLLIHEHVLAGQDRALVMEAIAPLEMSVFRGRAPRQSWQGLLDFCQRQKLDSEKKHQPRPVKRVTPDAWDAAICILQFLAHHARLLTPEMITLRDMIELHCTLLRAFTLPPGEEEQPPDRYGEIIERLTDVTAGRHLAITISRLEYRQILTFLLDSASRAQTTGNPNIKIWGLLEARLLTADRLILAGLNEQGWPAQPRHDPFLTRTIRKELGLPLSEESIGQEAHDFVQAFVNTPDVILSRALKKEGSPTIPSRFLQRIAAFAGADESWAEAKRRGQRFLHYADSLDKVPQVTPVQRPSPVPMPADLPLAMSVTEVETLLRDPYALYARRVLRLDGLDSWNAPVDYAVRGQIIHDLVAFVATLSGTADELKVAWHQRSDAMLRQFDIPPETAAFWSSQFSRIGAWFVDWHAARITAVQALCVERYGAIDMNIADGYAVRLGGIADRIERTTAGLSLIDFKTGSVPTAKSVQRGLSPQLTLEAAMAMHGAFGKALTGIAPAELLYVRLNAGREGSKASNVLVTSDKTVLDGAALAQKHFEALHERLRLHHAQKIGFRSRSFPANAQWENPYDHLARVAEWSRGGEDADDE